MLVVCCICGVKEIVKLRLGEKSPLFWCKAIEKPPLGGLPRLCGERQGSADIRHLAGRDSAASRYAGALVTMTRYIALNQHSVQDDCVGSWIKGLICRNQG